MKPIKPAHPSIAMLLASLLACVAAVAIAADLLEPEQAFRFSARYVDPVPGEAAAIEVRYRIAEGYYLYRQKFAFSASPAAVKLGPPQIPPGVTKRDEFFGESQTHRGELSIRIPLEAPVAGPFTLKVVSQGCADAGVCFLPQSQSARLLPGAAASGGASFPAKSKPAPRSSDRVDEVLGR